MQQIDENSADFLFKLESIVRMVVQEISAPMIEKYVVLLHMKDQRSVSQNINSPRHFRESQLKTYRNVGSPICH